MNRMCKFIAAGSFSTLLSLAFSSASYAAVVCSGHLDRIAIHPQSGVVQVSYGHGMHYICQIGATYYGTNAEICNTWLSMLLTAQASKRVVDFYYADSLGSCSNLPNWAAPNPAPYYVQIKEN